MWDLWCQCLEFFSQKFLSSESYKLLLNQSIHDSLQPVTDGDCDQASWVSETFIHFRKVSNLHCFWPGINSSPIALEWKHPVYLHNLPDRKNECEWSHHGLLNYPSPTPLPFVIKFVMGLFYFFLVLRCFFSCLPVWSLQEGWCL